MNQINSLESNMDIIIRNEIENDRETVEHLTREAFWNLYMQGCDEHYLVHKMRSHPDFIKDLAFVALADNKIAGHIMYTKSYIADESESRFDTITFGPLAVLPEYQKKGVGAALINHSKNAAAGYGHKAIIILGHPHNYIKHGFKVSRDFNISDIEGRYPFGQMVLELEHGALQGVKGKFYPSDVYNINEDEVQEFDRKFAFKKKEYRHSQYQYQAACRAYVD